MARGAQALAGPTSQPAARSGERVLSVRFSEQDLRRLQAYATIHQKSPNAVVREAVIDYMLRQVDTPEHRQAVQDYEKHVREELLEPLKELERQATGG
jgi:predicted transcriptional regulator